MERANLLEFLNKSKTLQALSFSTCNSELVNFLDLMSYDEQFTQRIDIGLIYFAEKSVSRYFIVDGLNRILSLSLLLHALCECYKKTSAKNDKAIITIRTKYLFDGDKTKLKMPENMQVIYEKIVNGEKLSGKEKKTSMFKLLHHYWTQIKEDNLHASEILKMIQKVTVTVVEAEGVNLCDLYYEINKHRKLNQLLLIKGYLSELNLDENWNNFCNIYDNKQSDLILFFKNFFQNQFNYKEFEENKLYDYFVNYFQTMCKYMKADLVLEGIKRYANLYKNLLNVNMPNEVLKQSIIDIKMLGGEDTFPYLLSVYSDYDDESISEATFVEILATIKEYLQNRQKTPNNVTFNELVKYLNALLACK